MRTLCLCVAVIGLIGCTDGGPVLPSGPINIPDVYSCSFRNADVEAKVHELCGPVIEGCKVNTVTELADKKKVFIVDTGVSPFYHWEPYPTKWCN